MISNKNVFVFFFNAENTIWTTKEIQERKTRSKNSGKVNELMHEKEQKAWITSVKIKIKEFLLALTYLTEITA